MSLYKGRYIRKSSHISQILEDIRNNAYMNELSEMPEPHMNNLKPVGLILRRT